MPSLLLAMQLHGYFLFLVAVLSHCAACQEYSDYRGQCSEVSFNGDLSVIRAMGCGLNITQAHQTQLLLDRCLSFDNSTTLVTGQG